MTWFLIVIFKYISIIILEFPPQMFVIDVLAVWCLQRMCTLKLLAKRNSWKEVGGVCSASRPNAVTVAFVFAAEDATFTELLCWRGSWGRFLPFLSVFLPLLIVDPN